MVAVRTSNNTTNDNVPALEQHAALQRGDTIQVTNGAVTIQLTGHSRLPQFLRLI